jgi:hypothetical protein
VWEPLALGLPFFKKDLTEKKNNKGRSNEMRISAKPASCRFMHARNGGETFWFRIIC